MESAELCVRTVNGCEANGRPLRIDPADIDIRQLDMLGATRQRDFLELQAQMVGVHEINAQAEVSFVVSQLATSEVFKLLAHFQKLAENNPADARAMLVKNPALTHALLHAQFVACMCCRGREINPMAKKDIERRKYVCFG